MFPSWWSERFGQTSPLGYRLRAAFPERWLRIHSLPQSKRYPDSAAELDVLLHRHRTVAAAVLSPDTPCKLLTPRYEPAVVGSRSTLDGFGDRGFEC
ncbi:MAG: hypothetical protein KDK70_23725, partial [Myxococcales bacterium]|nr:hypothetical protein [Myxococcales bacterium]